VGCGTPGQKMREGELALTGSVKTTIHPTSRPVRALRHKVLEGTDTRALFRLNSSQGARERRGPAPEGGGVSAVLGAFLALLSSPTPEPCAFVRGSS
jgi:hypothetical protein